MELTLKLKKIRNAATKLRLSSPELRNQVLNKAAELLVKNQTVIIKANEKDLKQLPYSTSSAFRDRLLLNEGRIEQMAISLRQVANLPDPLSEVSDESVLANGLRLKKVRSPLGVIFMIFESRPNVAIEAFSMGFKSGNAMILKGGKESQKTTFELYKILEQALKQANLPKEILWGMSSSDRKIVVSLLKQNNYIDVVVPRGGSGLINFVVKNSSIPIIKNDRGLCHVYVHEDANLSMAVDILLNAKTHRPAVCNSMETMLIHERMAEKLLPLIYEKMNSLHVKWFGCKNTLKILNKNKNIKLAKEKNFSTEYLDLIVNCKVVKNIDEAISHIQNYGSGHSECIVTSSSLTANKFQTEIDAAVVYWNASTRFTDGFEFGLGGELGISTQKLHVRGPVGLQALTNLRWLVVGTGQTRT